MAAINARFSLLATAIDDGTILCYVAKDYAGNVPLSHTFQSGFSTAMTGAIASLAWSPDGYCLFVAYEKGWTTWSVFGRDGPSTFNCNIEHAETSGDTWLTQIRTATWLGQGAQIMLTAGTLNIFQLDFARSAAVGYFSCANLVRALIQTPMEIQIYKGHELPDLTSISSESSLWHHAQYPAAYLNNQWPIRTSVISQDGRYVAIAGRRGIAHYSVNSGRWKTFSDPAVEASFAVRGGMCWFGHILAVATENAAGNDLRLYSRDLDLGRNPLYTEIFNMPIVFVGPSGEDSLLVYTHENILYHYVISMDNNKSQLIQVGQIAFHGVVRAPSRVRSVSWVVPESQLRNGDPSRDVEFASVLFLVDDKLVLLQPSRTPEDDLKYDLRVIAQHVEYYILMRDQLYFNFTGAEGSAPQTPSPGAFLTGSYSYRQEPFTLRDSLWTFTGQKLRLWPAVSNVLSSSSADALSDTLVDIPVDFYPLSILLTKGIVLGIETTLLQRRDTPFPLFRSDIRTQLFLPYVLRHQLLVANDHAAAFAAVNQYQHLSYFPHALEILLHHILDDEHERKRKLAKARSTEVETALADLTLDQKTPTQPTHPSTLQPDASQPPSHSSSCRYLPPHTSARWCNASARQK
ncbi:Guanine nucleotide exchange factor subunit ric1 [Cyphellophora attinorum]|uniref:Guanine nucleotide exchange factor subunit ric1 n=1 Tax=Cyphellophora attinorum TaxID=1664694 RepID=A0A0N0NQJ9_9EURO|nr:Guanine nucleotide exchange factor subunit ric1 [Phialophora attinorum]KPI43789.1 Guanine nucleotide exchange factor subunit ric1 [Phialophora attinorum]